MGEQVTGTVLHAVIQKPRLTGLRYLQHMATKVIRRGKVESNLYCSKLEGEKEYRSMLGSFTWSG